ncbi:hypothetical protein GUJ93_ZPchr0005g15984 [Zizania palustris]|uniref:Uncharacterized protein n=1 Tax=Zizania palustris TaxID=103762 RepID=A0A8J5VII3_ZIZPA|nr:hypothetical protein GUJ93_ZPchr0005g15984 [Zizania palustris]
MEEANNLLGQKNSLMTEGARLSSLTNELSSLKNSLYEDKIKCEKVASDTMDNLRGVLEYFGTSWALSSTDDVPLLRRLKMIQAAAKTMNTTGIRYGEIFGHVAALRVLRYYEDLGLSIALEPEVAPVNFSDDRLLTPSIDVATAWEAFQPSWRAEGRSAIKAWIDEGLHQKQARSQPLSSRPPSDPKLAPSVGNLVLKASSLLLTALRRALAEGALESQDSMHTSSLATDPPRRSPRTNSARSSVIPPTPEGVIRPRAPRGPQAAPSVLQTDYPSSQDPKIPSGGDEDLLGDAATQVVRLQEEVARWRQEDADRLRSQAFTPALEVPQDDRPSNYPKALRVPEEAENASFDDESPLHPDLQKVPFDPRTKIRARYFESSPSSSAIKACTSRGSGQQPRSTDANPSGHIMPPPKQEDPQDRGK